MLSTTSKIKTNPSFLETIRERHALRELRRPNMEKLSLIAVLTLSTMLSACGGGGGGHSFLPPTIPDNTDEPSVICEGVTCMTNEGLSNQAKRAELYNKATSGKSKMKLFAARNGGDPIDSAYTAMNEALTGWYVPDGSGSLDVSDPVSLRKNLILAGFEKLPQDDEELKDWAAARQYLIKRHAEKAYKMYGKQNDDVRLDNVKLHLVEDTSNQDTFINFTLDNAKNINGIEIYENDFTSEAVTDKISYNGGEKFSSNDILHKYTFTFDGSGKNIYIFISEADLNGKEKPDLAFIKEKLQLKLRERAAEDLAGGSNWLSNQVDTISESITKMGDNDPRLKHDEITRNFDVTYASYGKDLKNGVNGGNLLYSDFGMIGTTLTQSDTIKPIVNTQVFAGGYDTAKINPTEKMTFKGDAIAGINYKQAVVGDNGIIKTDTLELKDGKATLTFDNNGTEKLNVAFNNWYDVDVTKNLKTGQGSITFSGGDKIENNNFKFKGIDKTAFAGETDIENKFAVAPDYKADGHTSYTNSSFIGDVFDARGDVNAKSMQEFSGAMDIGYYGKDGNISEATGYVMYGEDSLNGKQVKDMYVTNKDIQEFMDKNGIDDMTLEKFKKRNIIETVQMQLGVGMQKSK